MRVAWHGHGSQIALEPPRVDCHIGAAGLALVGCADESQQLEEDTQAMAWSYRGESGPEHWSEFKREFRLCGEGRSQSPIDISSYQPADGPTLEFGYDSRSEHILRLSHATQVVFAPGSELRRGTRAWQLDQLHYHTPSEHTIDGSRAAMELHLVHVTADGAICVVGVLYDVGDADSEIRRLLNAAPEPGGKAAFAISAAAFAPADLACFHYDGSLTTPPCTESIEWYVMRERRSVSATQLSMLKALTGGDNSRPLQPRNGRAISLLG